MLLADFLFDRVAPDALLAQDAAAWQSLTQSAVFEGVAPLFYWKLKNTGCLEQVPTASQAILTQAYYATAARNQLLSEALAGLRHSLTQVGILPVALKGAALAATVYPDPALRPMYDLDLLVSPTDLSRAVRVVQRLEYRLEKLTYHALLRGGPGAPVSVELHWCLPGGDPAPDLAAISDPELFEYFSYLYCCAHLLRQHAGHLRLIWLYDLHLLRPRLVNPDRLAALADRMGLTLELAVAERCLSSPDAPGVTDRSVPTWRGVRRSWRLLPRRARLQLTGAFIFPSPAYMRWRYHPRPAWLWPLYYPRRLLEWLWAAVSPAGGPAAGRTGGPTG